MWHGAGDLYLRARNGFYIRCRNRRVVNRLEAARPMLLPVLHLMARAKGRSAKAGEQLTKLQAMVAIRLERMRLMVIASRERA